MSQEGERRISRIATVDQKAAASSSKSREEGGFFPRRKPTTALVDAGQWEGKLAGEGHVPFFLEGIAVPVSRNS